MASLRIKVQVGEESANASVKSLLRKFVYVLDPSSTKTVAELIQTLQVYIAEKFSLFNVKIVQLVTHDGFVLPTSDLCSSVLKDNDHIICVDMKRFVNEFYTYIKESVVWLEQKNYDATNNNDRMVRIGLNSTSALFIRLYGTSNLNSVYVFGIYELLAIANKKQADTLIGRLDHNMEFQQSSPSDWFLECRWEYDPHSDTTLFVICSLKIGSSEEVWSAKLQLILDRSRLRIEKGELTYLSGANDGKTLTNAQLQRLKELAAQLPPPVRTGPQIDVTIPQNLKLTKHECEGESSIRMAYGNTNKVHVEQNPSDVEGTSLQEVTLTHIVFSKKSTILPEILNQKRSQPTEKPITVTNLSILYQSHDGSWKECQDIAIAAARDAEPKWLSNLIINIEPDKLMSFSIKGTIVFKGLCGRSHNTCRLVHRNLPQPLKLKIVATDNFNKQCSLIVEQLNQPLQLPTPESVKADIWKFKDLLAFVFADNCENDERCYLYMCVNGDGELVIGSSWSTKMSINRKSLLSMEFNAKKDKATETALSHVSTKDSSGETKVTMLFDPVTYMAYAVRCQISTSTSKTEETVLIPVEKIA